ncbi:dolichyl-phosphate beta-glucosyltransferase [Saprolegnia diclina VS20]|uniref:dolichyl-phosphate beta-glucosyltransferase n=1 Tax=Saprolegnia diclina (strain VS20) TaxID=1156394 RepID=T0PYA4_SAPDV|nr:dolichyl-phosphate beta-glucosyltransferase [Saprolegnia diclina VS20]EQC26035.1 dolichyl-phosphate beta-glucosyltransferase [Saprolegnia diclina VS20]|eukprot:XP_008620520.1 dolichyl-phosphate beta-glucosyltransferase [Saprolegnia diclina VS20]
MLPLPVVAVVVVGAGALLLLPLLRWFFAPVTMAKAYAAAHDATKYRSYTDPTTPGTTLVFPCLSAPATRCLSLIVPAFNEEERIEPMLDETIAYLEGRAAADASFTYEIIVVDDCSTDKTVAVVEGHIRRHGVDKLKLLRLESNHGKGGAVRMGVLKASGEIILMADADAATKIDDFSKLEALWTTKGKGATSGVVVCGSRAHLEGEATAKRHPLRNVLMHGFHWIVATLCVNDIRDTQCGFKLFDRKAAQLLFPPLHIERWGFDVELLYLAHKLRIPCYEVAVRWQEIPGSKLNVIDATFSMLREMLLIPLCYNLGVWRTNDGAYRLQA